MGKGQFVFLLTWSCEIGKIGWLRLSYSLFTINWNFPANKMFIVGLRTFVLVALLCKLVNSLSFHATERIKLQTSPLIGGPSWLPVHVKVVIDENHAFDFVPLNPTSKDTLRKLVSLQAVPAEARILRSSNDERDNEYVYRARTFCERYQRNDIGY